jgi:hypothetical protein
LGPSLLLLGSQLRAEGRYIARRTDAPRELQAIVRYVHFPQTLQTSDHLYRQYARRYLMTYLERGLITKPQRQGELDILLRRLSIPDAERQRIESEIPAGDQRLFARRHGAGRSVAATARYAPQPRVDAGPDADTVVADAVTPASQGAHP